MPANAMHRHAIIDFVCVRSTRRTVASACPFCMTMLRDGLRDQGHEDVDQLDVAEVLWKSVSGESALKEAAPS